MNGLYCVTFVGDYFNLTTVVEAESEDKAKDFAAYVIGSQYGWDVEGVSNEINVELEGTY